jgi:2-methylisocitrate lyase-like PEP mutase family enzyme
MHCASYLSACIVLLLAAVDVEGFVVRISTARSAHVLSMSAAATSNTQKLRDLLAKGEILTMPCCYDGLTARLVEQVSITNFNTLCLHSQWTPSLTCHHLHCYPCSAKIEQAGFPLTFMTGFGVSAVQGFPDTQLISYGEMLDKARTIVAALHDIPCIGDGDTGYGNAVNVKRTVRG